MMVSAPLRLAPAGLAAPLVLATASFAQPSPPPAAPAGEMSHRPDPAQMRARMADRLRAILQLQPSQDAALNAFLDAMKPPAGDGDRMPNDRARGDRDADEQLTTPQRLDKMLSRMDERRARFAQIATATKTFYGQLTPAQQRAFDALPMGVGFRGAGGRMGRPDKDGDHGGWRGGGGPHEMGPGG